MKYEIIKDCSPYYITYKHTGIDELIALVMELKKEKLDERIRYNCKPDPLERFYNFDVPSGNKILEKVYCAKELDLRSNRVSIFALPPGWFLGPHKDGDTVKMGINYHVGILDDKSKTSWFTDETFEGREFDSEPLNRTARVIKGTNWPEDRKHVTPVEFITPIQGEAILFNNDIFHTVDNIDSPNERTILTLRSNLYAKLDFFQSRKIMFGY